MARYPNPLYTLMKMGESYNEDEEEENDSGSENEVQLLIYSCFGASSAGGK